MDIKLLKTFNWPGLVMRLSGEVVSESDLEAHVLPVIAQGIIDLTEGELFVVVTADTVRCGRKGNVRRVSCKT